MFIRVVGPGSDPALTSSQVFRKPATPTGSPITIFLISPHRSTNQGASYFSNQSSFPKAAPMTAGTAIRIV